MRPRNASPDSASSLGGRTETHVLDGMNWHGEQILFKGKAILMGSMLAPQGNVIAMSSSQAVLDEHQHFCSFRQAADLLHCCL